MPEYAVLRVAHIGPDPDQLGGMETVLRAYATPAWPGLDMSVIRSAVRGSKWLKFRTFLSAVRLVLRSDVDRFHVHLSHRGSFVREGALTLIASLRAPTVATIHGSSFVATASRGRAWRILYRQVLRRLSSIAVLNDAALEAVKALTPGTPATIVSNPGPVSPAPDVPTYSGGSSVVFAGRVGHRKGIDTLLGAWPLVVARHPDARLIIAGPVDPDLTEEQRSAVASHYRGALTSTQVQDILRDAACATLPSRGEGQPMFLIEALAFGVPIVVTDVGGMPGLAAESGIAIPVADKLALSDAITSILDGGPAVDQLRSNAIRKYTMEFSVDAHSARLRELYTIPDNRHISRGTS